MKIKNFKDLKFQDTTEGPMTWAHLYFENGYGISVVQIKWDTSGTLGKVVQIKWDTSGTLGKEIKWDRKVANMNKPGYEVAVMKGTCPDDGELCYDLPGCDEKEVTSIMQEIQNLSPTEEAVKRRAFLKELRKI